MLAPGLDAFSKGGESFCSLFLQQVGALSQLQPRVTRDVWHQQPAVCVGSEHHRPGWSPHPGHTLVLEVASSRVCPQTFPNQGKPFLRTAVISQEYDLAKG